jgi:general secretion pathway protein C
MQLPIELTSIAEKLARLPQQKIARASSVLLLVYIAYLAAQMTWVVVPGATGTLSVNGIGAQRPGQLNNRQTSTAVSTATIQALNLFGLYAPNSLPAVIDTPDAPKTSLNLTLTGVVASDDSSVAAAIIAHQGRQETYGINDVITGTKASLVQVLRDRVLIKQSGRTETLMLDGVDYKKQSAQAQPVAAQSTKQKRSGISSKSRVNSPSIVDHRDNVELKNSVRNLKNALTSDPGKITDYLKVSPKRSEGKIIGYSLRPGKDPEFFKQAGLKSGDVALQMNGHDLSVPAEAAQAMRSLKQQLEVSLLVDRNGDMLEILFSIDN